MARDALTGSRIRERRTMTGMKQAELARSVGISASYLNLIEHNRRRIGGKLLLDIAGALDVEPHSLTEGAEAALVASLREAASEADLAGPELARADEFAGRFPGWAGVLAATRRRVSALERTVETLTDRMAHDPHLAASMHELLSTAAAIRSTAAILDENRELQPEWRARFHGNLAEDSRRLSDSAQALVGYLDADMSAAEAGHSPQEEVEAFLERHGFSFDVVEDHMALPEDRARLVADAPELRSAAARHIAQNVLQQAAWDAAALPLDSLREAMGGGIGTDPAALARQLHQPVGRVLRRLAALRDLGCGLVVCDRSGTVIFRKSVSGFTVPRFGDCCPLWPLFAVLGHPGMVVSQRIEQLGRSSAQFDCFATCETQSAPGYNATPLVLATMLILPAARVSADRQEVGATCRVCPREACSARREPSILETGL